MGYRSSSLEPNRSVLVSQPLRDEHDMTGRIKTVEAYEIIGSQWNYGKLPITWGEAITGTGALTGPTQQYSTTYLRATTGTASGDSVVFQTKRHFRYQVFRTHAISWAFVFGQPQTNVKKFFGQGNDLNGWFVEQSAGNYFFVVRSNVGMVTGVTETRIARANWNLDKLDGTGPSGLTLDLTKGVSYVIEYVWHGTQGLRFGVNYFDRIVWCHDLKYTGTLSEPFSRNAILPLRAQIINTGAVGSPGGEMQIGPVSFNIYGGQADGDSYVFASGNKTSPVNVASGAVPTYLLAARPAATVAGAINRAVLVPLSFDMLATDVIYYEVVVDAIIAAGTFTPTDSRSIAEVSFNPSSVTNERVVATGYLSGGNQGGGTIISGFAGDIFASLDGTNNNTPLCFAVRAYKTNGNANVYAAVTWKEVY